MVYTGIPWPYPSSPSSSTYTVWGNIFSGIFGDKDFAFEDSDSFAKMGFSQKEFNAENEELVDVDEEPEEDEDDSDFFDDAEENTLDEE